MSTDNTAATVGGAQGSSGEGRRVVAVRPRQRSPPALASLSRALDVKLRRLKARQLQQASELQQGSELQLSNERRAPPAPEERPRFITTVKTGQFLLPPPSLARLLGLEQLYPSRHREPLVFSYSSEPKPVANRAKRSLLNERNSSELAKSEESAPRKNNLCNGRVADGTGAGRRGPAGVHALACSVAAVSRLFQRHAGSVSAAGAGGAGAAQYGNVMHDKRVVRGNTFAAHPQAAGDGLESAAARAARTRRRALSRRAAAARLRPASPPPAPGRRHHPVQTEYYLEELFDKGVEMEVGVQTDLFVDRPPTPIYVPAKTGADAWTQIYPGDLFDFELEVQPILEVLVGKTVEQALSEVAQEEELSALREQQRRYCELRDAERAERQRLATQDLRLHHEKERRVAEARVAQEAAVEARERAAAATLVQRYVAALLPATLAGLRDQGYLLERVHRGIDEEFVPWLVKEVSQEIESLITSRDLITEIVRDVVEARGELYRAAAEREHEQLERDDAAPESITPPSLPEPEPEEEPLEVELLKDK